MNKRNCLGCGQFADRYHRCPAKGKARVPTAIKPYKDSEGVVLEPEVLFANKSTIITLLPDGSLLKTKTGIDGVETVTEAGKFAKLFFASKIAKVKKATPVQDEPKKDKVEKAWETYVENDDAYSQKNKEVETIAGHIKDCKELIIRTDESADKLFESAKARCQSIVDKASAEVRRTYSEVQRLTNEGGEFLVDAVTKHALAVEIEKKAVGEANKIMDDMTLKVYSLKSAPRNALASLEAELAIINKPAEPASDSKIPNPLDLL